MPEVVPQMGDILEEQDAVSHLASPSKTLISAVIPEASEYTRSSASLSTHGGAGDTAVPIDLKLSGQDRSHSPNSEPG